MSTEANNEDAINAAQDAHNTAVDSPEQTAEVTTAPVEKGLDTTNLEQNVTQLDQTSTGEAKKTPQALPTAGQENAISSQPNTHAAIVNPKTGLSHNAFTWFHEHVLAKIPSIYAFVTSIGQRTFEVVKESENSSTYAMAQANVIAAATALASAASVSVAEKGLNPMQDGQTLSMLESLVTAVHTYIGILETEYNDTKSASEVPQSN